MGSKLARIKKALRYYVHFYQVCRMSIEFECKLSLKTGLENCKDSSLGPNVGF